MPTIMHGLYSALAVLVVIAVIGGTLYVANLDRPGHVQRAAKPPATRYVIRQRGRPKDRR